VAQVRYLYGTLARRTGQHAAALAHFRAALALYRQIDARPDMARCLAGIGRVALAQPDLDLAAASLAESLQLSLAAGQRLAISRGIEAFAALAVMTGELATAARLAGAARALRTAGWPGAGQPPARRPPDALLEAPRQRLGQAAVDALVTEGARLSTHEALALALGLHVPGDPRPAAGPVPEPGPGTGPGTGPAAPVPAGPRPAAPASPPLTSRELQIAGLVAQGLSNRGIATELTISPATAARHVANIFAKLGFTSRAQVAAWVAQRYGGRAPG
jgi:DNA-binding CsgD family transcriptional regulator